MPVGAEVINYAEYVDYDPTSEETKLEGLIDYFDNNWQQEGLPSDWYSFGKAGFSMRSQMTLLDDLNPESKNLWLARTEQDVRGFTVEYLRQDLVHPVFYTKEVHNGRTVLIDARYRKRMIATVSPDERNGAVVDSLEEIEDHLDNPGAAAIMISPEGWTGLETDTGEPIKYPDSWLFGFVDHGDHVVGFGVKTDFSLEECRIAVAKLTGRLLSPDAPLEDYVRSVALIDPRAGISTPQDFMRVLKGLRSGVSVYKDRGWEEVEEGVNRLEEINRLQEEAEEYITEFARFTQGEKTKFELQKALAVTLLRISALHIEERKGNGSKSDDKIVYLTERQLPMTYGRILEEVEKIPGCAGGGNKVEVVDSILERMGVVSKEASSVSDGKGSFEVFCEACKQYNTRPFGKLLSRCQNSNCPDPRRIACVPRKEAT